MTLDDPALDRRRAELAARLEALERAAAERALPRGAAGDRIRDDVVVPAGPPACDADRELLFRAETARARLYLASGAKTALDAATALLFAAEYDAPLAPDADRAAETACVARAVLERLRPLRSKRRSFRVFAALAGAVAVAPGAAGGARELLDLAPIYFDGATRRFPRATVGALLDKIAVVLARDPSPPPEERERLRAVLFRLALDAGDARRATDHWPGAAYVGPEDFERLARAAIGCPRLDDDLLAAIENALRIGDGPRSRLERALRDRARIDEAVAESDLPGLEGLNRRLAVHYGEESWPWRHLLAAALRRGRTADALAAFARLAETATDLGDAPASVAPLLLEGGFRRLAVEFGDGATRAVARAELALGADPLRAPDDVLVDLERLFLDDTVPPLLRNRAAQLRGRLAFAAGRLDEAVEHLERALSRDHDNPELSGDLAEVLAARGDFRRVRAFVDVALEAGEAPRLLELRAAALEAHGDLGAAADALKRALELDADHASDLASDGRAALVADVERAYAQFGRRGPSLSPLLARLRADAETAAPALRRALPRPDAARRRAAHLADRAERPRDVLALLAPWRARLRDDEDLSLLAARAATAVGRPADAVALLEPFPGSTDARVRAARGEGLAALGRHAEAAVELEAAQAAGDVERAGAALVRLELARGRPEAALAVADGAMQDPLLPRAVKATFHRLRAAAFEELGDAFSALKACAASLERFETDAARAQYARIAVTAALTHEDAFTKADLLFRAYEATTHVSSPDATLWGACAAFALGRRAALTLEEAADRLADLKLDCGPGGRSRVVVDPWLRRLLEAPPSDYVAASATPEPVAAGTDTAPAGPFE